MSHDLLITLRCEIQGSLTGGGSVHKRSSRHQLPLILSSIAFEERESQSGNKQKSIISGQFFTFANFQISRN